MEEVARVGERLCYRRKAVPIDVIPVEWWQPRIVGQQGNNKWTGRYDIQLSTVGMLQRTTEFMYIYIYTYTHILCEMFSGTVEFAKGFSPTTSWLLWYLGQGHPCWEIGDTVDASFEIR